MAHFLHPKIDTTNPQLTLNKIVLRLQISPSCTVQTMVQQKDAYGLAYTHAELTAHISYDGKA